MSFDPRYEDYLRLALRHTREFKGANALAYMRKISAFEQQFQLDADDLALTDQDRAFHLCAKAAVLIDYELPFANENNYEKLLGAATQLLDEALAHDKNCFDALRMKELTQSMGFETYYRFLVDHQKTVRAVCEQEAALAEKLWQVPAQRELAQELAWRPYVRWLASMASKALICGRYLVSLNHCQELLALDPQDHANVSYTMAYAAAKLEQSEIVDEIEAFSTAPYKIAEAISQDTDTVNACLPENEQSPVGSIQHTVEKLEQTSGSKKTTHPTHKRAQNHAWIIIARLALAYKQGDYAGAEEQLIQLMLTYPHAAISLVRQDELPDGTFSRHLTYPFSEEECLLAISEASVLFQEGRNDDMRGPLGAWIASNELVLKAAAQDEDHALVRPYELDDINSFGGAWL